MKTAISFNALPAGSQILIYRLGYGYSRCFIYEKCVDGSWFDACQNLGAASPKPVLSDGAALAEFIAVTSGSKGADLRIRGDQITAPSPIANQPSNQETMSMTEDQLAEQEALLADITPGRWGVRPGWTPAEYDDATYVQVVVGEANPVSGIREPVAHTNGARHGSAAATRDAANARFIAAAPTLVRDLLIDLRAARAEIARLQGPAAG